MTRNTDPSTSRELLEDEGGDYHALHCVVQKVVHRKKGKIEFRCSCGEWFEVKVSKETVHALRNVSEQKAS